MPIDKRQQLIKKAGLIALSGNLLLAIIKLVLGYCSKSLAVIGDGIDSSTDVIIAILTLIVGSIISRPSDKEHPWGHGRAETTSTMVLSFIILYAGVQLGSSSIKNLISFYNGNEIELPSQIAIIAIFISIAGKILLCLSQLYFGKKANSSIILANALNMKNDIIMSCSVLIGLLATTFLKISILDSICALIVSAWVIKASIQLFLEVNTELMDGTTNQKIYKDLFSAIKEVEGASHPHRVRIRKISSRWDIDLDIEVNADMSVHDAHEIAEQVTQSIKNHIPDVYDIMVHIEPEGHEMHHPKEEYGLREEDL